MRNAAIEAIELKNPVVVEQRALSPDSGGAGKFRGGLAIQLRVRNLVEGRWNLQRARRTKFPPWGLWGGKQGAVAEFTLKLPGENEFKVVPEIMRVVPGGTEITIRTYGGGGWGDPKERDPESVRGDVAAGFVSVEAAERDYSVSIDEEDLP